MAVLLPAINARTEEEFLAHARVLRDLGVPAAQVDISDGIFGVPRNFTSPDAVARELVGVAVDLHLMVRDIDTAVAAWKNLSPLRVTVHIEVLAHPAETFEQVRNAGSQCGLALGPHTPVEAVFPYLSQVDMLLFVAVPPGASGQRFDPETIARVQTVRQQQPELPIGVDGGITAERIPELLAAGASTIVVASAIFGASDPRAAYTTLKRLVEG